MRRVRIALLCLVALMVLTAGCLPKWVQRARGPQTGASSSDARNTEPPAAESTPAKPPAETPARTTRPSGAKGGKLSDRLKGGSSVGSDGPVDLPNLDPMEFAAEGYEPTATGEADIDDDGVSEGLVVYQGFEVDSVGEPVRPAYISILRSEGSGWQEWTKIVGENDERFADSDSLVRAGDINGDGTPELILRFFGFGVSSRPENVYVYQLLDDGSVTPVIVGGCVEMTSKDGFVVAEVDSTTPGPELIFALVQPSDGPESDPHRFAVEAWGWNGSEYEYVSGETTSTTYASGSDAIQAVYGV